MWLFLWRTSLLYTFPLAIWLYCDLQQIAFHEFDAGRNLHKWIILAMYLGYVTLWLLANRYLVDFLRGQRRKIKAQRKSE
ncbi:MAG: hypothetical protein ACRCYV_09385 [Aeromonas sp.]